MHAGVVMVTGVEMWAWMLVWAVVLMGVAHPASGYTSLSSHVNIKNLKVKVPRVAFIGDDAELECTFPWTDPRDLYSIKWWRDNDQFYQYIPKNKYPKMKFNVTGITVDDGPTVGELRIIFIPQTHGSFTLNDKESQNSTEFKVSLKNLSLKSSGMFTCEVISDDNFETFRESANMTVIDPPDRNTAGKFGPVIEVAGWSGSGPLEVQDGEQVEAVCLARGSNPPVLLTWYNNNTKVPREFVRPQTSHMEGFNTYTSSLRLILSAGRLWDDQGRLLLRCTAEIPGLFSEAADLELHNAALRQAQLSGFFAAGITTTGSPSLVMACVVLASLVYHALTHTPSCS